MANVKRKLTIELSQDDLREAVERWATEKGLISDGPCKVEVRVTTRTGGYGMHEYEVHTACVVVTQE